MFRFVKKIIHIIYVLTVNNYGVETDEHSDKYLYFLSDAIDFLNNFFCIYFKKKRDVFCSMFYNMSKDTFAKSC